MISKNSNAHPFVQDLVAHLKVAQNNYLFHTTSHKMLAFSSHLESSCDSIRRGGTVF